MAINFNNYSCAADVITNKLPWKLLQLNWINEMYLSVSIIKQINELSFASTQLKLLLINSMISQLKT